MKGRGRRWSPGNNGVRRVQWRESSTIKTVTDSTVDLPALCLQDEEGEERGCVYVCAEDGTRKQNSVDNEDRLN